MTDQHEHKNNDQDNQQGSQYDTFVEHAKELFNSGKGKTKEAFEAAAEKAQKQLSDSGLFSSERGKAFKEYLIKDMQLISEYSKEFGEEAKEKLEPARVGAGALSTLSSLLHTLGEAFNTLADKTDQALLCKTGEITSAGSLTCVNCSKTLRLKQSGHIPPCPNCSGTHFKKGY